VNEDAHWTYIALAYGATFAIVGALVWRILGEYRRLRGEIARFERNGRDQ
jgi:heme exporter protein CcmD